MSIQIKELRFEDFNRAIDFACVGMHIDSMFRDGSKLARKYTEYFWYEELAKSTDIIAAYDENDEFAGVLLAEIYGKDIIGKNWLPKLSICDRLVYSWLSKFEGGYNKANNQMLASYSKDTKVDGEICFLSVDPSRKGQGIGSILLGEFESRSKGKNIFLYTDSGCTYQFYEKRGFERVGKREVKVGKALLSCYLYHKVM